MSEDLILDNLPNGGVDTIARIVQETWANERPAISRYEPGGGTVGKRAGGLETAFRQGRDFQRTI